MNLNKFEFLVSAQKISGIAADKQRPEVDLGQIALPDYNQAFGVFKIGGRIRSNSGLLTEDEAVKYHAYLKQTKGEWERDI